MEPDQEIYWDIHVDNWDDWCDEDEDEDEDETSILDLKSKTSIFLNNE